MFRVPQMGSVRSGVSVSGLLHQQPLGGLFLGSPVFKVLVGHELLLLERQIRAKVHGVLIPAQPARNTGVVSVHIARASRISRSVIGEYAQRKHVLNT